jgi:hypothetical protein
MCAAGTQTTVGMLTRSRGRLEIAVRRGESHVAVSGRVVNSFAPILRLFNQLRSLRIGGALRFLCSRPVNRIDPHHSGSRAGCQVSWLERSGLSTQLPSGSFRLDHSARQQGSVYSASLGVRARHRRSKSDEGSTPVARALPSHLDSSAQPDSSAQRADPLELYKWS